jgi:hypothetical protein
LQEDAKYSPGMTEENLATDAAMSLSSNIAHAFKGSHLEDNIKMLLKDIGWRVWSGFMWLRRHRVSF